ncbi:MAG: 16S rRNA processing protein RimM [Erythrobacter sp.]|nr:16S rRNA processing protein RimM [Erythrobacter sp.]
MEDDIELAAITGAHGTTGEVRLKLFGEGVEALSKHKTLKGKARGAKATDRVLTLKKVRSDNKGGAIARLAEATNRTEAERLRGTVLSVARDALPALEEDEYYHADLIGLTVVTDTGDTVGSVTAVQNYGATDILEIEKDPKPIKGMASFMVPMTKQAVIGWDAEKLVIAEDFAED